MNDTSKVIASFLVGASVAVGLSITKEVLKKRIERSRNEEQEESE